MKDWSERTIRRIQALADVAAMLVSFVLALAIRYRGNLPAWQTHVYLTTLLFYILVYVFLYLVRRLRQEWQDLRSCDAFDVLVQVLKEQTILFVLLILLLSLSHNFQWISRKALLYLLVLAVLFTYVFRLCLWYLVRRFSASVRVKEHYVIVTTKPQAGVAHARLEEILPADADIAGFLFVDPMMGSDALFGMLETSLASAPPDTGVPSGEKGSSSYYEIHRFADEKAGIRRGHVQAEELPALTYLPDAAHVFVYLSREKEAAASDAIVRFYRENDIPVSIRIFMQGGELPRSAILNRGTHATVGYSQFNGGGEVLGVRFVVSDVERAAFKVMDAVTQEAGPVAEAAEESLEQGLPGAGGRTAQGTDPGGKKTRGSAGALSGEYICFSNVHTTVVAHDDPSFREVLNGSVYTFADGTPIARQLSRQGFPMSKRVAGPDFMNAIFRATMDGSVSHYFYGSTQETIDKLCEELPKRYPGIRIAGAVSPPFRPETEEEDAASVAAMNASGAAFIWIGLGAPKQEKWMAAHRGRVCGVMLGVGAGFNFYAGTVKRAPKWIQKIGMEWFYRLIQDPKRLANRYIVTNLKFLWYMLRGREDG